MSEIENDNPIDSWEDEKLFVGALLVAGLYLANPSIHSPVTMEQAGDSARPFLQVCERLLHSGDVNRQELRDGTEINKLVGFESGERYRLVDGSGRDVTFPIRVVIDY